MLHRVAWDKTQFYASFYFANFIPEFLSLLLYKYENFFGGTLYILEQFAQFCFYRKTILTKYNKSKLDVLSEPWLISISKTLLSLIMQMNNILCKAGVDIFTLVWFS